MHQPVVVIALQAQRLVQAKAGQRLPGLLVGHLGIGVVSANLVQHQKAAELQTGAGRQLEAPLHEGDACQRSDHQQLLDHPGETVAGCPAERQGQ